MDLGAPILDVSAGDDDIISDGVVTAAGYEPVVITPTETNADSAAATNHADYTPDVPIYQEESTTYDNVTIENEIER